MDHLPTDDTEFEELAIAEEDLIDAYVRNELSADDRKLVEKGLLSSSRLVERLHFAKLLAKAASALPQQQTSVAPVESEVSVGQSAHELIKTPWWKNFFGASFVPQSAFRLALGTCILVVILSGVALFAGWLKLRDESKRLAALEQQRQELEKQSVEQQSKSEEITAELQKEREQRVQNEKQIDELKRALNQNEQSNSQTTPSTVASILLLPGMTRDVNGGNELSVPPRASKISIQLALETTDYPSYRAVIKNSQGAQITKTGLKPRRSRSGNMLVIQVPANQLPPGYYTARVSGITSSGVIEDVHDYGFRVRRPEE